MDVQIRKSAQFIAENSKHVQIKNEKINEFCQEMFSHSKMPTVDFNHPLHPNSSTDKDFLDWIFVIDSLNYCFWKSSDEHVKWEVTYKNVKYSGYYALCAALKKAKDSGLNIADPHVLSKLSLAQVKDILRGDQDVLPILVEKRHEFLVQNSNILIEKYKGSFQNVVRKANRSASQLLSIVIEEFPSFRDENTFLGTTVAFYKRAQILVADLYFCASTSMSTCGDSQEPLISMCLFNDIEKLTMFADYRVPQVLKYFGILDYSEDLVKALCERELADPDSRFEIELRGNSIEAVERIVANINKMYGNDNAVNSVTLDVFLWNYRRENAAEIEREPFHRVVSVYY